MHTPQPPAPARTATHWRGVAVGLAVGVVAAMHIGKLPPALPVLRQEFDLSLAHSGWIVSAFNTLGLAASIFMGFAAGQLGAWRQCMLGLVCLVLGGLVGAAAPAASWLLVSRFLEGAGFLAAVVAAPGLIQHCTLPTDQRRALSFWGAYMPAGTTMGLLLAPLVLGWMGWRALWLVQAACALGTLALLYQARQRWVPPRPGGPAPAASLGAAWKAASAPLQQSAPWWIAFAFACYVFNFYALMVWLPSYLVDARHLGVAQASVLTALVVLVNLPGNVLGGWLMQRGVSRGGNVCLAGAATLLTASLVFNPALPDAWRYAACVAFSFAVGVLPGSVMSAAQTHAQTPQQASMVQGLINQGSNMGQFTSPLVVSAVVGVGLAWDRMLLLFWLCGACIVASGWMIRRLERALPRS